MNPQIRIDLEGSGRFRAYWVDGRGNRLKVKSPRIPEPFHDTTEVVADTAIGALDGLLTNYPPEKVQRLVGASSTAEIFGAVSAN